ncbi:hypothetical protein GCM10022278_06010 [Allohahella marinimesophila]|uniref:Uncharacterized protein n=1 Tax=Allohahella marinimesophila TaxID=1054972 RepID=A0ABP7NLH1_9GAMM
MAMVVVVVVVVVVVMIVGMVSVPISRGVRAIGARLRVERHFHQRSGQAEAFHHFSQHMVWCQPQPAMADLQGHMTVTEVIAATRQQMHIRGGGLNDLLWPGDHLDHEAIIVGEAFAACQYSASLRKQTDLDPSVSDGPEAAFLALIEVQLQSVGGWPEVVNLSKCSHATALVAHWLEKKISLSQR